jgi:hypothetical protein
LQQPLLGFGSSHPNTRKAERRIGVIEVFAVDPSVNAGDLRRIAAADL